MGLGGGTNNFAELSSTKFLIQHALQIQCRDLQLFGDSKIVCDWINKKSRCSAYTLSHILVEDHHLITSFDTFTCHHIFKERNADADKLSKEAAHKPSGTWMIQEHREGNFYQYYHQPFMDIDAIVSS